MKMLLSGISLLFILSTLSSCTKEVQQPVDELQHSKNLHYGVWTFCQHEIEYYTLSTQTTKKVEKIYKLQC